MSKHKKTTFVSAIFMSSVFLSGCGLFGGEEKIDPPQEATYGEEAETETDESAETGDQTEKMAGDKDAAETTVPTELYLIDEKGYVTAQTLDLPKAEGVAKQALEYLVEGGPVTEVLPKGFRAVLPADTTVSVNIKDGVATVNFSKEFQEYKAEDEPKILQAITWTLTQFDSVQKVKLQMNGNELKEMPVNGTPIGEELSRANGINLDTAEMIDPADTKAVTVYYLGGEEGAYYYVPVTRRVSNEVGNNVEAAVNELVKGPSYSSNLLSDFDPDIELLDAPKIEDRTVTLNFNESVYGSAEEKIVSQHLLNALVLSLTEQKGIESVSVTVNGEAGVVNDKGEELSEPVTRPEKVNTGSF
ncbi:MULTISPECIES: GerMN domain-containing protein [Bacillus]|uniref:GerMN domain-containing protein n=1 Tax=Bacillus TaxID=1386 RepID=UPI000C76752C|nr:MULTISPECIES: GerMN domain-containing protein [Bacillus]PLR83096.1 sporulation protein [Bacillus sp. V33-4]RSK52488.1 sporulation protein [Bacillus canaveralius]